MLRAFFSQVKEKFDDTKKMFDEMKNEFKEHLEEEFDRRGIKKMTPSQKILRSFNKKYRFLKNNRIIKLIFKYVFINER